MNPCLLGPALTSLAHETLSSPKELFLEQKGVESQQLEPSSQEWEYSRDF